MTNNLFVSYDLFKQGQNYSGLTKAIEGLGVAVNVQYSLWFVSSNLTAEQVRDKLRLYLDRNDSLIVVDAENNSASSVGIDNSIWEKLAKLWS